MHDADQAIIFSFCAVAKGTCHRAPTKGMNGVVGVEVQLGGKEEEEGQNKKIKSIVDKATGQDAGAHLVSPGEWAFIMMPPGLTIGFILSLCSWQQ